MEEYGIDSPFVMTSPRDTANIHFSEQEYSYYIVYVDYQYKSRIPFDIQRLKNAVCYAKLSKRVVFLKNGTLIEECDFWKLIELEENIQI